MRANRFTKYGNRRVEIDGIKFDSMKEARRWQELRLLEQSGLIRDLRRQVPIKCDVNGEHICKYIADFMFEELADVNEWLLVVEDAKGFKTDVYKLKKKLVAACTGIDIREV